MARSVHSQYSGSHRKRVQDSLFWFPLGLRGRRLHIPTFPSSKARDGRAFTYPHFPLQQSKRRAGRLLTRNRHQGQLRDSFQRNSLCQNTRLSSCRDGRTEKKKKRKKRKRKKKRKKKRQKSMKCRTTVFVLGF